MSETVSVWEEQVSIPTYRIGKPNRNPMFLEKRVYQGSSGVVYPYPVIEEIEPEKSDVLWNAVFLENEYLKLMILPELGGRLQMALDKTNDYQFVYYNRVIKPALVGLAGPWISGGIEFNWPQHHRPNTYGPVQHQISRCDDGGFTVWCSEIDRMHRTKGMHGFTLYPDKAYLEIQVRLFNRTDLPQTFLWWANPAIHVDEHHQSIFPPDVHAVMDHGKRAVSSFPIATGEYYKVDYSPGTDISRYRNIPVPTSYMAYHSDYNFVGSYDHGKQAGLLHVCNHHISPGKKQWTWGTGDFAQAWERHLTDQDGPYIELMCGVYTDNQPDFSWLMAGEQKSFSQFFLPYKGVGVVQNASIDAAISLEASEGMAMVRAYVTSRRPKARVVVANRDATLLEKMFDGSPRECQQWQFPIDPQTDPTDLIATLYDNKGKELVAYQPRRADRGDIPEPASAIESPQSIDSVESLYLAGRHLEQYRHATREPGDYYQEALRRDPGELRCNNAMGLLLYRQGQFPQAEERFRKAIQRLTRHNPNPYDGEPYYNLGLALVAQNRHQQALDAFYKATWNEAWQAAGFFALARIACRKAQLADALTLVDQCLRRNADHHSARHLQVYLLAELGHTAAAVAAADEALSVDPFNVGALFELCLCTGGCFDVLDRRLRDVESNYLELALDYAAAGLHERAMGVVTGWLRRSEEAKVSPLAFYYLADFHASSNDPAEAQQYARRAVAADLDCCFPNRLESIGVLQRAMLRDPSDSRAPYLLGNLWYDRRQYQSAIECWEQSRRLDPTFPTVHRNLGLAYFNKRHQPDAARQAFQTAFELDPTDARVLFELDQLAARLGHPAEQRLTRLDSHPRLVDQRDDLYLQRVMLLNQLGRWDDALQAITARDFHPWEGGEGKVAAQYVYSVIQSARLDLISGRYEQALKRLRITETWPPSIGEGKLDGIRENNIHYLMGLAYRGLGDSETSRSYLDRAATGVGEPTSAVYYNDQPPDMIFYQGLAMRELGDEQGARERFEKLIEYGNTHLSDTVTVDYFAVSLPEFLVFDQDLDGRNEIHCRYMMALGYVGLGERQAADEAFRRVLDSEPNHLAALAHHRFGAEPIG